MILGPEATGSSGPESSASIQRKGTGQHGLEQKADAYWAGVDEWIGLVTEFLYFHN
jgi:hypothetical protein